MRSYNKLTSRVYFGLLIILIILYSIFFGHLAGNPDVFLEFKVNFTYGLGFLSSIIINVSLSYGMKDKFGSTGFSLAAISSAILLMKNYIPSSIYWIQMVLSFGIIIMLSIALYRKIIHLGKEVY